MENRNQSESSCAFTTEKSLLEGLALVFFIVLSLLEMTSYSYESSVFSAELLSISLSFRVVIEIGGPSAASSRPSLSLSFFGGCFLFNRLYVLCPCTGCLCV